MRATSGYPIWAVFLFTISAAFAQVPGPRNDRPGPGPAGIIEHHQNLHAIQIVRRYLELAEEQREAIRGVLRATHEEVAPLRESVENLNEALRSELQSGNPDEVMVGALVIEIHNLNGEIRELWSGAAEAVEGLLTEEQLEKYRIVRRAALLKPVIWAFEELGLLPPPPRQPTEAEG